MFGLKKKTENDAVDFSAPLERALKNPVRVETPTETKIAPDLRQTLAAIEAAFYVIDRVREILTEASELVLKANDIDDLAGRAILAEQFDELRQSITHIIDTADSDAKKLLAHDAKPLKATLGVQSCYTVAPSRLDTGETGLDLLPPVEAFSTTSEVAETLGALDRALAKVDEISSYYINDAQFLISRLEKQNVI